MGEKEAGSRGARAQALAVLRVRGRALSVALLPAAVAVVLVVGGSTGHLVGPGWDVARWVVSAVALFVLLAAAAVALVIVRARPATSPTVPVGEESAPDLYRMVRDLADRLDVPAPSAIALTPDCDSWLEDRSHPAHGPPSAGAGSGDRISGDVVGGSAGDPVGGSVRGSVVGSAVGSGRGTGRDTSRDIGRGTGRGSGGDSGDGWPGRTSSGPGVGSGPGSGIGSGPGSGPVLVIGSPFLWWMRVGELRAVLAPVVAGTGPSAHPDIAAARRFVRGLDAAVAVTSQPHRGPLARGVSAGVGWSVRLLLRACRAHAAEMERGVAAAAAERAQTVDYGLRIVAQEQVGLAYAGWDRLLTRVALPAWRMGRWPSRLDAGVVAALTELSRRDRLAEGFTSRLGERPACDLLEEPGAVDEAASLLAARLFHGGPAQAGPDWAPVDWDAYPEEVVDRKWRTDAARLHRVLDTLGIHAGTGPAGRGLSPTLARVMDHLTTSAPCTDPNAGTSTDLDRNGSGRPSSGGPDSGWPNFGGPDSGHPNSGRPDSSWPNSGGRDSGRMNSGELDSGEPSSREPSSGESNSGRPDSGWLNSGGPDSARPNSASGAPEPTATTPGTPDLGETSPADARRDTGPAPAPEAPHTPRTDTRPPYADMDPHDFGTGAAAEAGRDSRGDVLAARLKAELAKEEAAAARAVNAGAGAGAGTAAAPGATGAAGAPGAGPGSSAPAAGHPGNGLWDDGALPLFPLQPPRTARELLADHVTAMVCCAAMDTAGATPGLDWLDGPTLLVRGQRAADLTSRVLSLVEDGDPGPLRTWLRDLGVRAEKPVRLV